MTPNEDFDKNLGKLLMLLRKMLKQHKHLGNDINQILDKTKDKGNINLNLCFFTFFPMSPEEFMEIEETLELHESEEIGGEGINLDLSSSDIEFLKRHGIKF